MNVRYGSPGHKGVKTLMAVGADDLDHSPVERAVKVGGFLSVAVWGFGVLIDNETVKNVGFGAAVGLFGVQVASGVLGPRQVEVVRNSPTTAADWNFLHSYRGDSW